MLGDRQGPHLALSITGGTFVFLPNGGLEFKLTNTSKQNKCKCDIFVIWFDFLGGCVKVPNPQIWQRDLTRARAKFEFRCVPPRSVLPEKVHFAIELPVPGKALLRQVAVAVAALHALGVPGSVQHVEQEPVQDGPLAAGAQDHHVSGLQGAESQPSHTDCVARTGAARFCAEQRLDSGRRLLCRRETGVNPPGAAGAESRLPVTQSTTRRRAAETAQRAERPCPPQSRAGNTIAGQFGVIPPSLRERSPHVATFTSLCLRGLSRGSASARRIQSSDWRTASLIPVPDEPITAQLLWLRAHRLQAGPEARRNTCVRVFFTSGGSQRIVCRFGGDGNAAKDQVEVSLSASAPWPRDRPLAQAGGGAAGPFSCTDLFTGKCTRISCSSSTGEPAPQPAVQRNLNIYQQTRAVSCTKANMRRANSWWARLPSPPSLTPAVMRIHLNDFRCEFPPIFRTKFR